MPDEESAIINVGSNNMIKIFNSKSLNSRLTAALFKSCCDYDRNVVR